MRKEDYQTMNCIFSSFRSFVPFVIVQLFSLQVLSCTPERGKLGGTPMGNAVKDFSAFQARDPKGKSFTALPDGAVPVRGQAFSARACYSSGG